MATINDADLARLVRFMRDRYGINLEHKRQLIDARLSFDVKRRGFSDLSSYVTKVIAEPDGEESRHMVNKLSTNYTYFFRETDYIDQLYKVALPDLAARGKRDIRIWCGACSSGQEAYSVAMALEHQRQTTKAAFDYNIIATDINTDILEIASAGIYPEVEYSRIPKKYLQYITKHMAGGFRVSDEIRRKIAWRYENLLDADSKPGEYDVIFCRNVMIYFKPELRREMTVKLYSALRPSGYLFTGTTESIDLERVYFRYIAPAFYKRKDDAPIRSRQ